MKSALPSAWRPAPALHLGDSVAVFAPSGPLPLDSFTAGAALLSQRYRLHQAKGLLDRQGFLAGSDGRRLAELRWGLGDPGLRALFAGRGGHGLLRLCRELVAVGPDEQRPLPVIGFSDVTVLHAWLALRRQVSIHGPVVTQLASLPQDDREALWALLESPLLPPPIEGLCALGRSVGRVDGRLLGGNLEVLSRLCGTPLQAALLPDEPVVLLLEEVTEPPYRIDRALTQLLLAQALRQVCAIVVGDLIRCAPPSADQPTAIEVIVERAAQLGVPVLAGMPVGHGSRNRPLPLGSRVTIEPRHGRLIFWDAAVVAQPVG